jgi:hypothetical protein
MSVLWLIVLFPVSALAQTQLSWKVYVDRLYGYSIPVPANLQLMLWKGDPQSPWQNRSKTFQSTDGKVSLSITTHWTDGQMLEEAFKNEVGERAKGGDLINYSVLRDGWYVVSGTNSLGFEFYSKRVVFTDEATGMPRYITFDFVYPASQRKMYDPAVTKIAREFVPDIPGKYDRD